MSKFTVAKADLLPVLAKSKEITKGDRFVPLLITKKVFFSASQGSLLIKATDLDISYETNIPCNIENAGDLVIDAQKIYEIVKLLPVDNVKIEEMPGQIVVKAGSGEYKFLKVSPDDFPLFPKITSKESVELDSAVLVDIINKLTPFVDSHEYGRPALAGIHLENKDGTLWIVGADGRRMGVVKGGPIEIPLSINVPKKGMLAIKKLAENCDKICLKKNENLLSVASESEKEKLVVRLTEGNYPDVYSIIPKETESTLIVSKYDLLAVLRRVAIFFPDKHSSGMIINGSHDGVKVEVLSKEIGEAKEEMKTFSLVGDPFEVAINGSFLFDSLRGIKSDEVSFGFNGESNPCIIKGKKEDENFLSIIMPMQYKGVEK